MAKRKSSPHGGRRPPRRHVPKSDLGARKSAQEPGPGSGPVWLYGVHAVLEALANPARRRHRLLATAEAAQKLSKKTGAAKPLAPDIRSREDIAALLPPGAVHQGLALLADPLPQPSFPGLLAEVSRTPVNCRTVVVVLDQVTDPQNVGAVLRSAAAFGASALVTTRRHAPPETGALAKAASGALEHVPYIQVTNLSRALDGFKAEGFWSLGLAGEAGKTLAEADPGGPLALVLGAEGEGLRRLTREACDLLARLPTRGPIADLNVSNAAAVALYALLGGSR